MHRRPAIIARSVSALLMIVAACVLASCSAATDPTPAAAPDSTVVPSTTAPDQPTTVPPTTVQPTSSQPTTVQPTASTTATSTTAIESEPLRLAPRRDDSAALLEWDRNAISSMGHNGLQPSLNVGAELGEITEVSAVPQGFPVFQVRGNDQVIWQLTEEGPEGLPVVPEPERLTLEGAGIDADGEPVVYYQRRVLGDPEETKSFLMSFRPSDGQVVELAVTGGWESGAGFNHLGPLGASRGDVAVARWGAEGFTWIETIDLFTGDIVFDSQDVRPECFDGEADCFNPWAAVLWLDQIVGAAPVRSEATGEVDQFGLWLYDTTNDETVLMEAWPWDNGLWYAEDMFVIDDSLLVVSLEDGTGEPLPALFFDLVSGESWTAPRAAFLRPSYLS